MIFFLIILIILCLCLSSLCIYLFIQSRGTVHYGEKQRIKYSIQPSIGILTKKLPYQLSISNSRLNSISGENSIQVRSQSLANNFFVNKCTNRRQSALVDSKQIAQIEFSLPPTAEKFRRRSVAICNNIIESKQSTIDSLIRTIRSSDETSPCLLAFTIIYSKSSQIQIQFRSLTALPAAIQQLTMKIKLIPDGKMKSIEVKKILSNENIFDDGKNEYAVQFTNISSGKLHEKAVVMKFSGKDSTKKTIQLGQIGKIHFNQLEYLPNENPLEFSHEIELIKLSSVEILVALEQTSEHQLLVDIQRIKGIKIDQKHLNRTGFFQIILLDRHRPLSTQQTKSYRLNASTFSLNEPIQLNILAFNGNNLDRLMIMIKFYSNHNQFNEHRCLGRVKLASYSLISGTGTVHWKQFQERQSFSMWHTLIKQS